MMNIANAAATEQVTIDGITYDVIDSMTADDADARGLHNLANLMRHDRKSRQLALKRPKGRKTYVVIEYATRHGLAFGNVISLGGR